MNTSIETYHMMTRALCNALAGLCLALLLAPATAGTAPTSSTSTLFQRIGGEAVLRPVVAQVVDRTAADPRSHHHFDGVRLPYLKDSIYKFICQLSGGGCDYDGETMQRTHAHLKIRASEFDALVQVLREELDRAGVPAGAKNELLRQLAPFKRDIVGGLPHESTPAVPQ